MRMVKKRNYLNRELLYRIIIALAIIVTVIAGVYAIMNGRHYFNRRNLRLLDDQILSFGIWAPLVIVFLIFINILIPPIPIPIPLVEIAAGVIFGFWPGVLLVWVSQVLSSVITFLLSRKIGKFFLKKLMNSKFLGFIREFIAKKGALGVFVIRATMTSPFSISYIAGFMDISLLGFTLAMIVGAIPETILFVYLGTLAQHARIRLWYIGIPMVILSLLPLTIFLTTKLLPKKKKS